VHMRKLLTFVLVILFAVGLAAQRPGAEHRDFGEFGIMSAGPGGRTPVTGAPYSALETRQTQQTLSDGNQVTREEQSKVYRDGLGRVRIEHTMSRPWNTGAAPQTVITIFDPVGGFSYMLNPSKMTAVKMALPPSNAARSAKAEGAPQRGRSAKADHAVQTENLGTQAINNVAATGTRRTETIAAGSIGNQQAIQIVRESWISADLKVPVSIKSSDPRFGNTVMQLTNITQTEPDPSLFVVPSNYTVTTRTGRGR
jgi:hypothetical protein